MKMTRRATLLKAIKATDTFGGSLTTYEAISAFWCEPFWTTATQFTDFNRTTNRTGLDLLVRIESTKAMSVDDRIEYSGRVFAITGILPDNRQVTATINCESLSDAD